MKADGRRGAITEHDDALIAQAKEGDMGALDELIQQYYPAILRYCMWHAPNRACAEDAAQETFLKAIRHLNAYAQQGHFRAFLYQIAANTCIDMRRKREGSHLSLEALADDWLCEEAGYGLAEESMELRRLVRCLPERLREIVLLRFAQELSLREIAEVTHLPLRTAQSRLRAALKLIKKQLEVER